MHHISPPYPLPQPFEHNELERLRAQHLAVKLHIGGLLPPSASIQSILEHAKDAGRKLRVLELGSGSGVWAKELSTELGEAVEVVGIDKALSPSGDSPANCSFVQHDINHGLPFANDYFDIVHDSFTIWAVEEFHILVDDIRRVLRPGGIFISIDVVLEVLLEEGKEARGIAPGSVRFLEMLKAGALASGVTLNRFTGMSTLVRDYLALDDFLWSPPEVLNEPIPCSPWSSDPKMKEIGSFWFKNASALPLAFKEGVLRSGISEEEYSEASDAWLRELSDVENIHLMHPFACVISSKRSHQLASPLP
ncbi:S-adenosyl-L-methionine-dependent methyltransferase [Mrakia frigida]|uniref:class I SAM-dependent methyltransferase n=1 Tax=Mrakia frigida TaxID=29902 RepID=UPI003FCBFE8C